MNRRFGIRFGSMQKKTKKTTNSNIFKMKKKAAEALINQSSWYYDFEDGWGASVSVEKVTAKERNQREKCSRGFAGYDWMIKEILMFGRILKRKERKEIEEAKRA